MGCWMSLGLADPQLVRPSQAESRLDRAIVAIRVDQKGTSYIINQEMHPLLEEILQAARLNRTSYFYNVTGLTASALPPPPIPMREEKRDSQIGGRVPAPSKVLMEALLHEINAEKKGQKGDWMTVHQGDGSIRVEDVTQQVLSKATSKIQATTPTNHRQASRYERPSAAVRQTSPIPATGSTKSVPVYVMSHRSTTPEPFVSQKSPFVRPAPVKSTDQIPVYTLGQRMPPEADSQMMDPKPTTMQAAKLRAVSESSSESRLRTEASAPDAKLRAIDESADEDQDLYEYVYEDEEEEEEENEPSTASTSAPSSSTSAATTTTVTTKPTSATTKTKLNVQSGYAKVGTTIRPSTSAERMATRPMNTSATTQISLTPLPQGVHFIPFAAKNDSGLLVFSKNVSIASSTALPEFVIQSGSSASSTKPSFDLGSFLVQMGEVTSDLIRPNLFRRKPEAPATRKPPPPGPKGSVHNINRPAILSAFARPSADISAPYRRHGAINPPRRRPPSPPQHPQFADRVPGGRPPSADPHWNRPTGRPLTADEKHTPRPGEDHSIPVVQITEDPGEMDIITAPNVWNLIVSSSLTGQSKDSRQIATNGTHYGYVIDGAEEYDGPQLSRTDLELDDGAGVDALIPHQDSPSRLGLALETTTEEKAETRKPGGMVNPKDVMRFDFKDVIDTQDETSEEEPEDYSYEYYEDEYDPEENNSTTAASSTTTGSIRKPKPFPYGVNSGDLSDVESDEQDAEAAEEEGHEHVHEDEMEGVGGVFPEVISNSVRRVGLPVENGESSEHPQTTPEEPREVFRIEEAINALDKKLTLVPVDVDVVVNQTIDTPPGGSKTGGISGETLAYLLIGTLGGLSLLFLCVVGLTIRCRQRRFRFRTFLSRSSAESQSASRPGSQAASRAGSRRSSASQRMANQTQNLPEGEVATHKLGSWFTGRHSLGQSSTSKRLRSEMALPATHSAGSTVGSVSGKKVTRAYFTDGRTGSTRDLVTSGSSDSSNPGTPDAGSNVRHSWLHTSYKDRGQSTAELMDVPYYIVNEEDASDGERPRSANATVRLQSHVRPASSEQPPELPPKRRTSSSAVLQVDPNSLVDPMGSHITLQTEASGGQLDSVSNTPRYGGNNSESYWLNVDERLI